MVHAYITADTFHASTRNYKSEIGSQSTMCQVHAGAYVSLLTPGETNYSDCHPTKTTTYILHVVSITTHTPDRRKSIGENKQRKEKKIKEGKKREENETKRKRQEKRRKRQEKQEKTRQEEARQGKKKRKKKRKKKEGKMSY